MYTKEELERNTILEDEKKEAREEGIKEGIKEGAINKQIEIAKNLLSMNLSIEQIKEATGLTKEELERLKEEM
jgi:predicted transposase/invertase (TIGR01784 family)